jgi:O-antigen/teichoic acid export membrane protein
VTPEVHRDHQLLRRAVWINLAGLLGKGFWPLFLWLVATLYGAEVFGQFTLLYAPIELLLALCCTGFLDAMMRHVSRLPGEPISADGYAAIRVSLRAVVTLGTAAAMGLLLFGGWLVTAVWGRPALHAPMVVMAVAIPIGGTMSILLATLTAMIRNEFEVIIKGAVVPLLALAFAALASLVSHQQIVLAISYLAAQAVGLVISLVVFARFGSLSQLRGGAVKCGSDAAFSASFSRRAHLRFGLAQGLNVMLWVGVYSLDTLLLGIFVGDAAIALYRAGSELARVLQYVRTQFSSAFLPIAARYLRNQQRQELQALIRSLGRTIIRHSVWLAGVLSWLAAPSLRAMLHSATPGDTVFIDALLLGHLVISALALAGNTLVVAGKQRIILSTSLVMTAANLGLNLWLVPRYGLLGAAVATLAAMAVAMVAQAAALKRVLGLTMHWRAISGAIAGGAIAYAGAVAVTRLARYIGWQLSEASHALLGAVAFCGLYFAATAGRRHQHAPPHQGATP